MTRREATAALAVLGMSLLMVCSADAQRGRGGAVRGMDRQFMMKAAQSDIAEIRLGRLALERAVNGEVRDFAQRMVTDHTRTSRELRALASGAGVPLPQDTDAQHKAVMARLANLTGEAFDRAYMRQMVRDHEVAVALFFRESSRGRQRGVRAFAGKFLPSLRTHLAMARDIAGDLTGTQGARRSGRSMNRH